MTIPFRTILHQLQRLFKPKDEPPPVRERYSLDVKEALHAQYEKGKQAGLKEQAGLAGINVLEALHRKFQSGIQAGMRLGSPRCRKGHLLSSMKERFPGVFISICDVCSKQASPQDAARYVPGERSRQWHRSEVDTHELPSILSPKKGNGTEKH